MLLAALPLVLLVGATELVLYVLGLGQPANWSAAGRGFDPRAAYLLRDGDGWRTQLRDDPGNELSIGPKDGRRRVLVLGGSNSQVLPIGRLELELSRRSMGADRGWEIINLGREGYGSERVAILLEQALVLEPDVIVLYSGHNEFVEAGFRAELAEAGAELQADTLTALASQLRLFGVLKQALAPPPPPPEQVDRADPAARQIPWSLTQAHYEQYRQNLTRMCAAAHAADVPVILCTLVSNPLSPPYVAPTDEQLPAAVAGRFRQLHDDGLVLIPRVFREGLRPPVRLRLGSWTGGPGWDADHQALGLPRLRPLLGALAEAPATPEDGACPATAADTHWPSPTGWQPKVAPFLRQIAVLMERRLEPAMVRNLEQGVPLLEQALELVPDHPHALFDLGLALWVQGQEDDRAVALLEAAAAADRSPHAANSIVNDMVRELAASLPGVHLLDVAAYFRASAPSGLLGYEVLMDSNHLQPGARHELMVQVASAIAGLKLP